MQKLLKGLGDEAADVRAEYKRRGGNLDQPDASLLCHSLTAVEDRAELAGAGKAARLRLQRVRRQLEATLP